LQKSIGNQQLKERIVNLKTHVELYIYLFSGNCAFFCLSLEILKMEPAISRLFLKRDKLYDTLSKRNKRYVHPETVDNLLAHIAEIENAANRTWAIKILEHYLDLCEQNLPEINRALSMRLYNEMLYPLLVYYNRNLQFVNIDIGVSIFFLLGLATISFFFFGLNGILAVLVIGVLRILHYHRIRRQKRVFGFFF